MNIFTTILASKGKAISLFGRWEGIYTAIAKVYDNFLLNLATYNNILIGLAKL